MMRDRSLRLEGAYGVAAALVCALLTACAAAGPPGAAATASPAHAAQRQKGATMAETKHTTEEYWGSSIDIVTEPQEDGRWKATATVQSLGATANAAAPLHVQDQPTAEAAATAARSLAAGAIDAQRVTRGKP